MLDTNVRCAAKEFANGKYVNALNIYRQLGQQLGEKNFKANIQLCLNRLKGQNLHVPGVQVKELLDLTGFIDAHTILYADIDLNAVDGSAIWMSSMASILASQGKTLVISKNLINRDVIVDNIYNRKNVLIITPNNLESTSGSLDIESATLLIRYLDEIMPNLQSVVVRGLDSASSILQDRQFYKRVYSYLTDIYIHTDMGIDITEKALNKVDPVTRCSAALLTQTKNIENLLRQITNYPFDAIELPPPVLGKISDYPQLKASFNEAIRIGYAGKIAPMWGIQQLAEWVETLRSEGFAIDVIIIGDKISGAGNAEENKRFRSQINTLILKIGAIRLGALSRSEVAKEMAVVNYAWCWRPPEFEEHTVELSTKLVEGVLAGKPCITYPSQINLSLLGKDYPFFIRDLNEFRELMRKRELVNQIPVHIRKRIENKHSLDTIVYRLQSVFTKKRVGHQNIVFASHDFKFINPYISFLKKTGYSVTLDKWEWGICMDENQSMVKLNQADIIFCEWGLANAAWYSINNISKKPLYIRIHAQEVREKARKITNKIMIDNVSGFIFVSERVMNEALALWKWPKEKCHLIPNFVLDQEYIDSHPDELGCSLGIVGITPQSKRFDRALDLLEELVKQDFDARLYIKGYRPEEYSWMHAPSRRKELDYYFKLYDRIEHSPAINGRVIYDGFSNDVARWYQKIDFILSPSDHESFHYALADGVLSGCIPIVWSWESSNVIYDQSWIVNDMKEAIDKIKIHLMLKQNDYHDILKSNREFIVTRYSSDRIFHEISLLLNII